MKSYQKIIKQYNKSKILFTAGPASLIEENIINLKPCFGRGDKEYLKTEKKVLNKIKKISGGFDNIVCFQGSGSLGIEVMINNFLYGRVLLVQTGYYSERILHIIELVKKFSKTILHHGHIRLLKKASKLGKVIVALTVDKEILLNKGYKPELKFEFRKEILNSIKYVYKVIPSPFIITDKYLDKHKINILIHGNDNKNK